MALLLLLLVVLTCAPTIASSAATTLGAQVVRVVDGDTVNVRLDNGREETVRLIGVDTPETVHPTVGVETGGPEASAFTKKLLPPGQAVTLDLDAQERDRYGPLLAYVYLPDGRMVNGLLLREGLAELLTIPPNVKHVDLFRRQQAEARQAGRGMWAAVAQAPAQARVRLEVDLEAETAMITNTGNQPLDLSDCVLVSVMGNQRFTLPQGTTVQPGGSV